MYSFLLHGLNNRNDAAPHGKLKPQKTDLNRANNNKPNLAQPLPKCTSHTTTTSFPVNSQRRGTDTKAREPNSQNPYNWLKSHDGQQTDTQTYKTPPRDTKTAPLTSRIGTYLLRHQKRRRKVQCKEGEDTEKRHGRDARSERRLGEKVLAMVKRSGEKERRRKWRDGLFSCSLSRVTSNMVIRKMVNWVTLVFSPLVNISALGIRSYRIWIFQRFWIYEKRKKYSRSHWVFSFGVWLFRDVFDTLLDEMITKEHAVHLDLVEDVFGLVRLAAFKDDLQDLGSKVSTIYVLLSRFRICFWGH